MREISFAQLKVEFKQKSLKEIKEGQCLKVTGQRKMAFYIIVHPEEVMKDRVEGICGQIDISRGR